MIIRMIESVLLSRVGVKKIAFIVVYRFSKSYVFTFDKSKHSKRLLAG